jgi:hypothetical protein
MKFLVLTLIGLFLLAFNPQETKGSLEIKPKEAANDPLVGNLVNVFQNKLKKLESDSMSRVDVEILQYLLRLIYIRQREVANERKEYSQLNENYV